MIQEKKQRGEVATILTLISLGLMFMGIVVGNIAVQTTTQTRSRAALSCHKCEADGSCTISQADNSCADELGEGFIDGGCGSCTSSLPSIAEPTQAIPTQTIPTPNATTTPNPTDSLSSTPSTPVPTLLTTPSGRSVTCSSNCKTTNDGQRNFCYNECAPDRPGYSRSVYCTSSGFEVGNLRSDTACGQATGPSPSAGSNCQSNNTIYKHGDTIQTCVEVACDGNQWVYIDNKCMDGQIIKYPSGVARNDCNQPPPTCADGRIAPTQPQPTPTIKPDCVSYQCANDAKIIFSTAKDGSIYAGDCKSGNKAPSIPEACGINDDTLCKKSGGNACKPDAKTCKSFGGKAAGIGSDITGRNIILCPSSNPFCCWTDGKPVPTIYFSPAPTSIPQPLTPTQTPTIIRTKPTNTPALTQAPTPPGGVMIPPRNYTQQTWFDVTSGKYNIIAISSFISNYIEESKKKPRLYFPGLKAVFCNFAAGECDSPLYNLRENI